MSRSSESCALLFAAMVLLLCDGLFTESAAQVTYGFDTGLRSHYVWRGITRRNAWVWQSDVYAAIGLGPAYLTGGFWWNFELTKAATGNPRALGYGARVAETITWFEASINTETVEAAAGFMRNLFDDSVAPALGNLVGNRSEVYGRLMFHPDRFSLGAQLWHTVADDLTEDNSTYFEGRVSWYLPVLPAGVTLLRFGARVGWQRNSPFHVGTPGSGVTHWDLFAETQVSVGLVGLLFYILPSAHVILNVDEATRRTQRGAGPGSDVKTWVGFTMSYQRR